jgi:ATP-dependent Zn protease
MVCALPFMDKHGPFDLLVGAIGLCRPRPTRASRRLTAYHEAGHAVMSTLLGSGVARITMPGHGYFRVGSMLPERGLSSPLHIILLALSGAAGAGLLDDDVPYHPITGASNDFEMASARNANLYFLPFHDQVRALLSVYMTPVRRIMEANSKAVHALGTALIDRRWMLGYEVEAIIAPHLQDLVLGIDFENEIEAALHAYLQERHPHRPSLVFSQAFMIMQGWRA